VLLLSGLEASQPFARLHRAHDPWFQTGSFLTKNSGNTDEIMSNSRNTVDENSGTVWIGGGS